MKVNDIVRLLKYAENEPNAYARIVAIADRGVYVANMNQPFQGTLGNTFVPDNQFKVVLKGNHYD